MSPVERVARAMTAAEALSEAMLGCEDGYSRHHHKQMVAFVMERINAAGYVVVPREATTEMILAGADLQESVIETWRMLVAASQRT